VRTGAEAANKTSKSNIVRRKTIIILISIGLAILFAVTAFNNGLIVRRYTVQTDKMDVEKSFRIVLITDLHSHIYGENQSDLISLIKKQQPDVILLAGDIADDMIPFKGVRLLLKGIRGIAPVYYVTGNHEFWSSDVKSIKEIIRSYGVKVLEGEYEQRMVGDTMITFAGIDDPDMELFERPEFDWESEMKNAFAPLRNEPGFKILLTHRPERIDEYKKYGFDLVVSGHSHGGQIRIPLIMNGLYAPNQGWLPEYAGGMYRHGALTHVVSRGASNSLRVPRIFNPPEIVVIDVKGSAR